MILVITSSMVTIAIIAVLLIGVAIAVVIIVMRAALNLHRPPVLQAHRYFTFVLRCESLVGMAWLGSLYLD